MFGKSKLEDQAVVHVGSMVAGGKFFDRVRVKGESIIEDDMELRDYVRVISSHIYESPKLCGDLTLRDGACVHGNARLSSNHQVLHGKIEIAKESAPMTQLRRTDIVEG